MPGFNIQLIRVEGGSGPGGNFVAGDSVSVVFRATTGEQGGPAGNAIPPSSWNFQEALFSGPATNYQLVMSNRDIEGNMVDNGDGTYTFTFPDPIPATVPNQINQANTIPYDSGTLAGQPLPDGTYTVGFSMRQDVVIDGESYRDATSSEIDFLFGAATAIEKRELVTDANCAQCHSVVRGHGDNRYGVDNCVLCHTNGAEDLNNPSAMAGETLGRSISFQTMLHKIHSGKHLPSVQGKTVDDTGAPVYGEGTPYVIVRSRGEFDFSHVAFPQWPHLSQGMPEDTGYDALTDEQQDVEDAILAGPTNCAACHGDPDGSGPLAAPADGDRIFTDTITTRACIACHDDWDPAKPYTANGMTMPAGLGDNSCTACHGENPTAPSSAIDVRKAHTHPLLDTNDPPLWGPGAGAKNLTFNVTAVSESDGDGDGLIEVGEKVSVNLDIIDRNGTAVPGSDIARMEIVVTGPMQNANLLYSTSFSGSGNPASTILGPGPAHSFLLPERVPYEIASGSGTVYRTARTPHYNTRFGPGQATTVWEVPAAGASTIVTTAAVEAFQNYVDVNDASSLSGGDLIVIDESNGSKEYLEIRAVQGNRLWFAAPIEVFSIRPAMAHAAGATVAAVTPTQRSDFNLDETEGGIVFTGPAPVGTVIVSYTTDFVVPPKYPGAINNSPSMDPDAPPIDERIGEWTGFDIVGGTYNIGIYGEISFDVEVSGGGASQTTSYTEGAEGETVKSFRLGTDGPLDSYSRISSAQNCYDCHRDLQFHGAHRRGFDNCLLCHGVSGAEDWAQYRTNGLASPESPGVSIEFREMIHKIHHGRDLANAEDYAVIGFRGRPHFYDEVAFPSFAGATGNCDSCHGEGNEAWFTVTDRLHPDQSGFAAQSNWRMVCGSCHDSRAALGHILANTGSGIESCATCHGEHGDLPVETVHKNLVR